MKRSYYVIVIGGDGTILRAIHRYLDKIESIRLLGIHTGTLGFSLNIIAKMLMKL